MGLYVDQVAEKELPPGFFNAFPLAAHSTDNLTIFQLQPVFSEPRGFRSYKFQVPLSNRHPLERVEREVHRLEKRTLLPINPGQVHHALIPEAAYFTDGYLVLFADPDWLNGIAREMFGRANLSFINRNAEISPALRHALRRFLDESRTRQPGYRMAMEGLGLQVASLLLRETRHNLSGRDVTDIRLRDADSVSRAVEFLHANYRNQPSLNDISREANYSPYHFTRLFKGETGRTPFQYLLDIKIGKAKELLKHSGNTVEEVGHLCGFVDRSHFARTFRRMVGVSPAQFRKEHRI